MLFAALTSIMILCAAPSVFGWGEQAHKAVAEIAEQRLTPSTAAKIAYLLGDGAQLIPGSLAKMSMWPDHVRARKDHGTIQDEWGPEDIEEVDLFNHNHTKNHLWHFVDLPLGAKAYPLINNGDETDPVRGFINDDDIVHALKRCVDILESDETSETFTKVQALRWIVHLVGDLHQPLHITSGYYDPQGDLADPKIITDPTAASANGIINDRGGNGLLFTKSNNLHAVWDACLAGVLSGSTGCSNDGVTEDEIDTLAAKIRKQIQIGKPKKSSGDHHQWPMLWASDSLKMAKERKLYGLKLSNGTVKAKKGQQYLQAQIEDYKATRKQYLATHKSDALKQMANAAERLASLLNNINWK